MSEGTFDLQLVGRHIPDQSIETDPGTGHKYAVPLPGHLEVGFVVGDQFVSIANFKAGNIPTEQLQQLTGQQTQTAQPAQTVSAEQTGPQANPEQAQQVSPESAPQQTQQPS